ncbi:MAG TPA: glycoside hydrolase family 57 protein [Nitrososphaerales archaeon]|nr:glycoside hydrolase family 57 protein [Nitrososphaerales archaeon]
MTYITFMLEIHQPIRLSRAFPYERLKRMAEGLSITDRYFDRKLNEEVFRKVAKKCYFPTFNILNELVAETKDTEKPFKVSLGVSGPFVEQAIRYEPQLVELLRQLLRTGNAEILGNTYYHSLSGLFPGEKDEFVEQVKEHSSLVRSTFDFSPKVFENTEFIYNDTIARIVESLGFEGILSEGVESVLGWRSPNYVYSALGAGRLKLILRHYKLTDDVGFRFSQKTWVEYPLMADKYVNWLSSTPGDVLLLAMDIETFGEHHWVDTGIFEFLKALPREVQKKRDLNWATPTEVVTGVPASGVILVPETKTISWADVEKDTTAWLQNPMQRISFERLVSLEPYLKEIAKKEVTDVWRLLQQSDHLYYMSTKSGGPGEVHSYFSPYSSPAEAFSVYDSVLTDYEGRVGSLVAEARKTKKTSTPTTSRESSNKVMGEAASAHGHSRTSERKTGHQ